MIGRTIGFGLLALATTSSALGQDAAKSAVVPNAEGTIPAVDSALQPCPTATVALESSAQSAPAKPGGKVALQDMTVMKTAPAPTKEPTGKASLQDFHRNAAPGQEPTPASAACAAPVVAKP